MLSVRAALVFRGTAERLTRVCRRVLFGGVSWGPSRRRYAAGGLALF
jgi:hypothetical protein